MVRIVFRNLGSYMYLSLLPGRSCMQAYQLMLHWLHHPNQPNRAIDLVAQGSIFSWLWGKPLKHSHLCWVHCTPAVLLMLLRASTLAGARVFQVKTLLPSYPCTHAEPKFQHWSQLDQLTSPSQALSFSQKRLHPNQHLLLVKHFFLIKRLNSVWFFHAPHESSCKLMATSSQQQR
jgi:hypothetical protein